MRLRVGLLALLNVLGFMAFTASFNGAIAQPVIPYLSTGYRYDVVAVGGLPGFELPVEPAGFSTGSAAFGSLGGCPLDPTVVTPWLQNTDLLLRKDFTLPVGASPLEVAVAIDNDIQVFINGTDISGGLQVHEGCAERDSFVFPVPNATLNFGGSNLLAVRARDRGGISYCDVEVRPQLILSSLSPAKVWVGLMNSDAVGLRLDLKAQVFADGQEIADGEIDNVSSGSSGFNNAHLNAIALNFVVPSPVAVPTGGKLEITLSVRRTCALVGANSGTPRLWFNDSQANSRFDATIDGTNRDFFLWAGAPLPLVTTPGLGPKTGINVAVNSAVSCSAPGGRPFKPFGTWSITLH